MSAVCSWIACFIWFVAVRVDLLKADIFVHEQNLHKDLMHNYIRVVRPITDLSKPVHVQLMFTLMRVDELDASKETMTSTFMLFQFWKDPRLSWDTTKYGNITSIRSHADSVWLPDLEIENLAPGPSWSSQPLPTIKYDGSVIYVPHKTAATYCAMDLTLFPFDTQTCTITFVPWTHNSLDLKLGLYGFDYNKTKKMEISIENHHDFQWEILEGTAVINSLKYSCCPETYQRFEVTIKMSRKTNFYRYVVSWPSVVACFLVPFLFAIPSHSPQKITYGLGLMVFESLIILIFVQTNAFDHKTVPNLAIFHLITLILTSTSLLLAVFTVSMCDGSGKRKPVPAWLQRLALNDSCLRRVLCLGHYGYSFKYPNGDGGGLLEDPSMHDLSQNAPEMQAMSGNDAMRDLSESVRMISDKMASDKASAKIILDWREVGRIVDRILGCICFLTVLILLIWSVRIWSG